MCSCLETSQTSVSQNTAGSWNTIYMEHISEDECLGIDEIHYGEHILELLAAFQAILVSDPRL